MKHACSEEPKNISENLFELSLILNHQEQNSLCILHQTTGLMHVELYLLVLCILKQQQLTLIFEHIFAHSQDVLRYTLY